nr:lysm domain-containing protein [Quercus suber]
MKCYDCGVLVLWGIIIQPVVAFHLWDSPADLPSTIPASCRATLAGNITCDEIIPPNQPAHLARLDAADLDSYCTPGCGNSLKVALVAPLLWAYNTTCALDSSSGERCYPQISNGTAEPCSDCFLKYEAALLSSDYGRGQIRPAGFSSLLSQCGQPSSKYPVQAPTTTSTTSTPTSTSLVPTCTGSKYTVQDGDTCRSIAKSNSIAEDRFIMENGIDYDCNTLSPGRTVCLGSKCSLLVVESDTTCTGILNGKPYYLNQLRSWNPTIHPSCDNLDVMVGRGICISPPGSSDYSVSKHTPTTTSFSMFSGEFVAGDSATYDSSTIMIPTLATTFSVPTTTYTVNVTQASIIDDYSVYCPVTEDFFDEGYSWEDLPDVCSSILEPYCTPDPNAASPTSTRFPHVCTPTIASASPTQTDANAKPSPLTPGTIDSCQQFYRVAQSDTCYGISQNYDISIDQFRQWNPYPGDDCSKLLLYAQPPHKKPFKVWSAAPPVAMCVCRARAQWDDQRLHNVNYGHVRNVVTPLSFHSFFLVFAKPSDGGGLPAADRNSISVSP